jgi:anti-sigma factor RsiW
MCPDPQLLSIYIDGELPSPWKEKLESHLTGCSDCREKFENFKRLHELLKKNISARQTIADNNIVKETSTEDATTEPEIMEAAKSRVWKRLSSKRRFTPHSGLLQRRLSIPLPAAAAAAIILVLLTALWLRGGAGNSRLNNQMAEFNERANFMLAAEEEMPDLIPAADISGVLQYLTSDGTDVIIIRLPESSNFLRSGEPIIRAADYSAGRRP